MLANIIPYLLANLKPDCGIINIAMTQPNTEQLLELVEHANQNPEDPSTNRLIIAQEIAALGFYMIGTAESQEVHEPCKQTYYDRSLTRDDGTPAEVYFFDDPEKKVLRATWSGKLALEGAVLGNFNTRNQRALLGKPLTSTPRLYGWRCQREILVESSNYIDVDTLEPLCEDDLLPHAEQALLSAVDDTVEGFIDVIDAEGLYDPCYTIVDPVAEARARYLLQPGTAIGLEAKKTIASLTVRGSDLWYTGINSMEYRKHATS